MTDTRNVTELLQRGQAAARVGRQDVALEALRQAVELAPDNVDAWLALAGVLEDPGEKRMCFETVLRLDPDHVEASLGLEMLETEGATDPAESRPTQDDQMEMVIAEASRHLEEAMGPAPEEHPHSDDETVYCAVHSGVETVLRCNRCGKPICTRCAVQTPVGYRCKECVGQQQATFFTGGPVDYVVAGVIAVLLGGLATYLMGMLGMWFFAIILGPVAGIAIAEVVRRAVGRRRSRYLGMVVGVSIVVGAMPALLRALLFMNLWSLLTLILFLVLAVGAAVARLR